MVLGLVRVSVRRVVCVDRYAYEYAAIRGKVPSQGTDSDPLNRLCTHHSCSTVGVRLS